jgi:hypothetical protein
MDVWIDVCMLGWMLGLISGTMKSNKCKISNQ